MDDRYEADEARLRFYAAMMQKRYEHTVTEKTQMHQCGDCPYGRTSPCIGACTKKVLMEMREIWAERRKMRMSNG